MNPCSPLSLAARCLLLLALCLFTFAVANAQSNTATLSGTVTDPNGAVVPGVTVTITNPATRLQRTTLANSWFARVFGQMQSSRRHHSRVLATNTCL